MKPRIRTIKPEAFLHEGLWDLHEETGFPIFQAFVGLWTQADREGRFEWRPRRLKAAILPYWDGTFAKVLDALEGAGFVESYEVDGKRFGWIPTFTRHQVINKREAASTLPEPHVHARARTCTNEESTGAPGPAHGSTGPPSETTAEMRARARTGAHVGKGTRTGTGKERELSVAREREEDHPFVPVERAIKLLKHGYAERYRKATKNDEFMGWGRAHTDLRTAASWAALKGSEHVEERVERLLDGVFADRWMTKNRWPWAVIAKDPGRFGAEVPGSQTDFMNPETDFSDVPTGPIGLVAEGGG